ncbi:hypothetical protein, partial [Actinoplanes sp. NPDC049265]|uniref:hypothetical protein n=1 Tax=Actinoplanes sp. NPDC049265 TaxID=3363902 RepID=UPI00371635BF
MGGGGGGAEGRAGPAVEDLDLGGTDEAVLARIEALLGDWVDVFLREAAMDPEDQELIRSDL